MWRLWLFLALIGLLIWGFARLQQRNGASNDDNALGDEPSKPATADSNKVGSEKVDEDKSTEDD